MGVKMGTPESSFAFLRVYDLSLSQKSLSAKSSRLRRDWCFISSSRHTGKCLQLKTRPRFDHFKPWAFRAKFHFLRWLLKVHTCAVTTQLMRGNIDRKRIEKKLCRSSKCRLWEVDSIKLLFRDGLIHFNEFHQPFSLVFHVANPEFQHLQAFRCELVYPFGRAASLCFPFG